MGLAASQARLLSITSRMADNELRSQLINNAKMRLTADTSKVSDEYIAALNRTQLMFTNFDLEGNEVYQDLTFSSLTAYSAYNTQYGIANNNGELIVSATDANNFESANGDLTEFLKLYGLEQTTDYWDTLKNSEEFNSIVVNEDSEVPVKDFIKGFGYYDSYNVWQPLDVTVDEMQAIYEANSEFDGITHYGPKYSQTAEEYCDYQTLEAEYISAREQYEASLKQSTRQWLAGSYALPVAGHSFEFKVNGRTFEEYYGEAISLAENGASAANVDDYIQTLVEFGKLIGLNSSLTVDYGAVDPHRMLKDHNKNNPSDPDQNTAWTNMLQKYAQIASAGVGTTTTTYDYESGYEMYAVYDENGNFIQNVPGAKSTISSTDNGGTETEVSGYGNGRAWIGGSGGSEVYIFDKSSFPTENYEPAYYNGVDSSGNKIWCSPNDPGATQLGSGDEVPVIFKQTVTVSPTMKAKALKDLYNAFRDNLLNNMSDAEFIKYDHRANGQGAADKWDAYKEAAANLLDFIYGPGNGAPIVNEITTTYKNTDMLKFLNDPGWVLSMNKNLSSDVQINGYNFDVDWDTIQDEDMNLFWDKTLLDTIAKCHTNPFNDNYTTTTASPDPTPIEITYHRLVPDPSDPTKTIREDYTKTYQANYQVVKDLFLIDCMIEHYGEPVYTWIDKDNKGEDGTAKAAWYTNLFNRMKEGYQKLDSGLRNSQDWLQFAFESGLVHMEQVDSKAKWNPTMYSNCAKITESTVDIDITLAEAKYKREMAKIQAKDKQYDIELKNIDTEHESLKQEAESIKKVIETNIKNNMKLFVTG